MIHVIDSPADWARFVNIVLGTVYLVWVLLTWRSFLRLPRSGRLRQMSVTVFVLVTVSGSIETILETDLPGGFRTYGYTLALTWALYAHAVLRKDEHHRNKRYAAEERMDRLRRADRSKPTPPG